MACAYHSAVSVIEVATQGRSSLSSIFGARTELAKKLRPTNAPSTPAGADARSHCNPHRAHNVVVVTPTRLVYGAPPSQKSGTFAM
jgi:hypothetical protein